MNEGTTPIYCANHPGEATVLRCNRCEKPICSKCAVRTPTGYRCRECVRGQQKVFDSSFNNAVWYHHILALVVPGLLSLLASLLVSMISGFYWGLAVLIAAPFAGETIARLTQISLRSRRSRLAYRLVPVGMVLGGVPALLFALLTRNWFLLIWEIVYLAIAAPVAFYRMAGIQLK